MTDILNLCDAVLLKIINYLKIGDIIWLSLTCKRLDAVCNDSSLWRNVNFEGCYQLSLEHFKYYITRNWKHVQSLNLNYLHWIPARYIQWAAKKCKYLQKLSIIGCDVKIEHWMDILTNCTDIVDISVPISKPDDLLYSEIVKFKFKDIEATLQKLRCLRIDVFNKLEGPSDTMIPASSNTWLDSCHDLERLIVTISGILPSSSLLPSMHALLPGLQELYLYNDSDHLPPLYQSLNSYLVGSPQDYSLVAIHNKGVIAQTWYSRQMNLLKVQDILVSDCTQLRPFQTCIQNNLKHIGFNSIKTDPEKLMTFFYDIGQKCPNLRSFSLCNPILNWNGENMPTKFVNCLHLDKLSNLTTLNLLGIHFDFEPSLCGMLKKLIALRKLSLTSCAILQSHKEQKSRIQYDAPNGFGKRRRLGVQTTDGKPSQFSHDAARTRTFHEQETMLKEMVSSCSKVEVIDLVGGSFFSIITPHVNHSGKPCSQPPGNDVEYLGYICEWYYLRQLTLANLPGLRTGDCLQKILSSCPWIEFLSLANLGSSHTCTYDKQLAEGLKHCGNLRDFRLEQKYCKLDQNIIPALQYCSKLQRFCAVTEKTEVQRQGILHAVNKLPNLHVVQLFLGMTIAACQELQKALIHHFKSSGNCPGFSVVVMQWRSVSHYSDDLIIPLLKIPRNHYQEITKFCPKAVQSLMEI